MRSRCDPASAPAIAGAWLAAHFVRPCNGITWAQTVLNQGELVVNAASGNPDEGRPHVLPLYFQNRDKANAPFALRGPKTSAWNENLEQVIVVLRCVAVACKPDERQWVVLKSGRGRISLMAEPDVGLESVWGDANAPLEWSKDKVMKECGEGAEPTKRDCAFPNHWVSLKAAGLLGEAGTKALAGNVARFEDECVQNTHTHWHKPSQQRPNKVPSH